MTVTVYSKPNCQQCTATIKALERKGLPYDVIDITEHQAAYDHVIELGYRQVPVVIAGDIHWSGFRPDLIASLSGE